MSYVRVSILGNLFTEEQWSVNPVYDPTGEFPGGVNQTNLDAACQLIANRSIPGSLATLLSTSGVRNAARVEVRDDATDALLAISIQASGTPQVGGAAPRLTAQDAVVASIRTNTAGASGRGRIYWPALGGTVGTNGRLSSPANTTLAADFKAYLNGIATDLGTSFVGISFNLSVRSKTTHTTPHATRIQVGNTIDTQRRRRDNLPESYASVAMP